MNEDTDFTISNDEKILITKQNIIMMLHMRGFIDESNISKRIDALTKTDINDTFVLELDNNKNYNMEIETGEITIKYYDYMISSSSKGSSISDFINKNANIYKIIIVKDYVLKSIKTLKIGKNNLEIFSYDNLMINLLNHVLIPKYIVLNNEERESMLFDYNAIGKDMPTMYDHDPIALYFNLKIGDICKKISKTPNGETVFYRMVIPGI